MTHTGRLYGQALWLPLLAALCIPAPMTALAHEGHSSQIPWRACDQHQFDDTRDQAADAN